MPDEPSPIIDDVTPPTNPGEADPLPLYPVYPPPPPPDDFPPPGSESDSMAVFGMELYEAVPESTVLQGLSAQYLETAALELPLTDAAQTEGNFVFAVQKDPNYPDNRHYTVFVGGTRVDALVILAVNLSPTTYLQHQQVGGSLGKLTPLPI